MSDETVDQKDVYIEQNGIGYHLTVGEEEYSLSSGEALGLFLSLLHALPEIPDGVRTAHHIRNGPRLTVRRHWSHDRNTIAQDQFQGFIHVAGTLVDQTVLAPSVEAARALASKRYGSELEVSNVVDSPGSREIAQRKATEWIISDFIGRSGMTVPELFRAIKSGNVPEGFDLDIVETTT